jgi:hypothetical protein
MLNFMLLQTVSMSISFSAEFFILANILLGVGMPRCCTGVFPRKEGWIEVLAGLAPSSQTLGSFLRILCLAKGGLKNRPQKYF